MEIPKTMLSVPRGKQSPARPKPNLPKFCQLHRSSSFQDEGCPSPSRDQSAVKRPKLGVGGGVDHGFHGTGRRIDPEIFSVLKIDFSSKYGVRAKTPFREDDDDDYDRASSLSPANSFRSERSYSVARGNQRRHISDPFSEVVRTASLRSAHSATPRVSRDEFAERGRAVSESTPHVFQLKLLTHRLLSGVEGKSPEGEEDSSSLPVDENGSRAARAPRPDSSRRSTEPGSSDPSPGPEIKPKSVISLNSTPFALFKLNKDEVDPSRMPGIDDDDVGDDDDRDVRVDPRKIENDDDFIVQSRSKAKRIARAQKSLGRSSPSSSKGSLESLKDDGWMDGTENGSTDSIKSESPVKSALKGKESPSFYRHESGRSLTHPTKRISTINEEDFGSIDANGLGSVTSNSFQGSDSSFCNEMDSSAINHDCASKAACDSEMETNDHLNSKLPKRNIKKRRMVPIVNTTPIEVTEPMKTDEALKEAVATIVVEPPPANTETDDLQSPKLYTNELVSIRPSLTVDSCPVNTASTCRSASFSGGLLNLPVNDAKADSSPTTPTEEYATTKVSLKPRAQTAPVCSTSLSEANNFTKTHTLPLERKKSAGGLVNNLRSILTSSDRVKRQDENQVGSSVSLASTSITGLSSGLSTPSESLISLLTVASDVSSVPDTYAPGGSGVASPTHLLENRASPRPTSPIKTIPEASEADEAGLTSRESASITDAEKLEMQRQEKERLRIDKRQFVMRQMYETEKSYVECLETLFSNYYTPLKNADVVDDGVVTDIFYKIPEIKMHHHVLLNSLENRVKNWDSSQIIGDILQNCFTKESVIETYEAFINNWPKAQESLKLANQKASFTKFSEHQVKEHRRRLKLDDLIIQPVQRVPRYELFIKDFLKYTPKHHPDFSLLQQAQTVLHSLAQRINEVRSLPLRSNSSLSGRGRGGSDPGLTGTSFIDEKKVTLKELEDLIEHCTDLVHPSRFYLRHDMVTLSSQVAGTKRDRCIFMFSDLVIITAVKRKSGTVHRKPSVTLTSPLGKHFLENNKHKLLFRIPLDCVTLVKQGAEIADKDFHSPVKKNLDLVSLEDDLGILKQIEELSSNMHVAHPELEDAIFDMVNKITKQLSMTTNYSGSVLSHHPTGDANGKLDLRFQYADHTEYWTLIFSSKEKRSSWEETFIESRARIKGCIVKDSPDFFMAMPVPKNRAGMQFSCASPCFPSFPNDKPSMTLNFETVISETSKPGQLDRNCELWVCISDGCVGQVCLLSMLPEPQVSSINTVCSSRIKCIAQVPCSELPVIQTGPNSETDINPCPNQELSQNLRSRTFSEPSSFLQDNSLMPRRCQSAASPSRNELALTVEEDEEILEVMEHKELPKEESISKKRSDSDDEGIMSDPDQDELRQNQVGNEGKLVDRGKRERLLNNRAHTMWLGTEDGSVHVVYRGEHPASSFLKTRKEKIHHNAAVLSIVYLNAQVFVSLASGDLVVYNRCANGSWNTAVPVIRTLGSVSTPVTKLLAVNGKLWCGRLNRVVVINPSTLQVEREFQVDADKNRSVLCMIGSSSQAYCSNSEPNYTECVWISLEHGHEVKLFDADLYDCIAEVSVKQAVTQKLQICDDIIRQHKVACLRITALLACKGLLWIGTSAGIILNLSIPLKSSFPGNDVNVRNLEIPLNPVATALIHGHTGHVRFLTSMTCPQTTIPKNFGYAHDSDAPGSFKENPRKKSSTGSTTSSGSTASDGYNMGNLSSRTFVISGGDGFEDFSGSQSNDSIGRDDSTNHLLFWEV